MKLLGKKAEQKTDREKVAERREEVLATGRKFKYPLQWARHRIIINTILITVVVFTLLIVGVWLALYRLGMTDEFLFRITKIVPVAVANVDDENVLFSDYLMLYRSSITSIERQSGTQFDGSSLDGVRAEYKLSALSDSEQYAYAIKLAKELNITISDEETEAAFIRHMAIGGGSEESFAKIIKDNFGLSKSEYKRMLYLSLLKSKVSIAIDTAADELAQTVEQMLATNGNDYGAVAEALGDKIVYQETGGLVDSKNIDGGRAAEAMKLAEGESSSKFVSTNGDNYYFVKLIKKTSSEVNFVSIGIPFTEFERRFNEIKEAGKINEYIEISLPADEQSSE